MLRAERAKVAVVDRIATITLHRPDRRNAVDHPMLLELLAIQHELDAAIGAHDVRVVVVTGTPPAFSAGADLAGVEHGQFAEDLGRVLRGFTTLMAPVIAAVDGPALGAGTQLALAADLRIATATSVFGIPAAKLGLAVDHWTIARAADEFTPSVSRAMLIAAQTYSGEQLHALGAVHRIGGLDAALDWASSLAGLAPLTIRAHKLGLEHRLELAHGDPARQQFEDARLAAWESADADEGRAAFLEKRPAAFRGE